MTASIAAIAFPVAAATAIAAKSAGSAIEGFGAFLRGAATGGATTDSAAINADDQLNNRLSQFQKHLASRIRNSGIASDSKVDVSLDEFGLARAFSNGQENTELSRWLSGEVDLLRQFSDLQSQCGSPMTIQIDLSATPP